MSGAERPAVAAGLTWTLTALVGTRLVTLVGLAALARLLAPQDFGLLAFALAYMTYVTALGDLGTGAALIYWPCRTEDAAQITFLVTVATAWIWLAATALFAPVVATFFENPAGAPILTAIAWSLPIQALGSTHEALCRKALRFRAWVIPELAMAGTKAVLSIGFALGGFGVWSLVWGHLAGHLVRTVLFWTLVPWRPTLRLPWDLVGPLFRYGRSIVAVNVLSVVVHHSDLLVVARLLGVTALGFYQMAAKIPEMTITLLVRAVSHVLFPALSRGGGEGSSGQTYLTALKGVALVTIPAAVVLVMMAEPLVIVLFGPTWTPAASVARALAAVACLRSLGTHAGDLLKASGRPAVLAGLAVLKAVVMIPALAAASQGGMVAVALAMVVITAGTTTLDIAVACVCARIPAWAVLASLRPGAAAGAAVLAGLALVGAGLPSSTPLGALGLSFTAALVAYLCVVRVATPELYEQMRVSGRQVAALARTHRLAPAQAVEDHS